MSMLQLEVVTPDKTVVSAQVEMAVCPGVMGEFGVLPHHVSLLSALKIGNLRYTEGGKQHNVFISGGFADVNNKVLTVLAESAELAEDIDTAAPRPPRSAPKSAWPARPMMWTMPERKPLCSAPSSACMWPSCASAP